MNVMTSRERVRMALNHQEPDAVPIDLGSTIVTTITRIAYDNLRKYLNLPVDAEPRISHKAMDTVYPAEDLWERYRVDLRPLAMRGPWYFNARQTPDGYYDEFNMHWRKASYYYDVDERPLAGVQTTADLERAVWPDPADPGRVDGLREEAKRLYETTDKALVADIMCLGPFEGACFLRGYDLFAMDLVENPKLAQAILDKITDLAIGLWDVFLDAVGDTVDVVAQGDDLGTQRGLFLSPAMYRRMVKPCHKRLYDFIHSKTRAKVFMHSCGSVYDVVPDLIECGVEILNPLQRSAAKMDIFKMKKEFGKDLSFWGGGIDVQSRLPFASLQEIEDEVKQTLDHMADGGGYVFVAAHNIQPDVSPDRIEKLYQSALKYRHYPAVV